ncbi:MAG: transporter substrate-binding protein [Patulibacter sp.]
MTDFPQTRRTLLLRGAAGATTLGLAGALLSACGGDDSGGSTVEGDGPIKVGFLYSLTGPLSITEKSLHDGALLAVEQINADGGIAGRQIEPVVEDYASDMTVVVQKAEKLIRQDKVVAVVGCYTSASRVAVIPTFQKNNALLLYGTYYEGLECDVNTFYGGAVPNQFLLNYVPWITENLGKSIYIVGSDYVYPQTVAEIVKKIAPESGGKVVASRFFQLGTTEFGSVISDIKAKKPDVIFSNLVGDSTPAFYKQFKSAGLKPSSLPIAATVTTEVEVAAMGAAAAEGHYQTGTYFQSLDNEANAAFVKAFQAKYGDESVTHMPLVGHYDSVFLLADAIKRGGGTTVEQISKGLVGATALKSPEGTTTKVLANHHTTHPSYVGKANAGGQFEIVASFDPVDPDPFPAQVVAASKRPTCPTPFKS